MKKILFAFGYCLIFVVVLVIIRLFITHLFPEFGSSKVFSYILYFVFVVGCIQIIRHRVK